MERKMDSENTLQGTVGNGPRISDVLNGTVAILNEMEEKIFGPTPQSTSPQEAVQTDTVTYLRDRLVRINDRLSIINGKLTTL